MDADGESTTSMNDEDQDEMEPEDTNDIDDDCGCSGESKKKKKALPSDARSALESGALELPYSDRFPLPDVVPCKGGCSDDVYCRFVVLFQMICRRGFMVLRGIWRSIRIVWPRPQLFPSSEWLISAGCTPVISVQRRLGQITTVCYAPALLHVAKILMLWSASRSSQMVYFIIYVLALD